MSQPPQSLNAPPERAAVADGFRAIAGVDEAGRGPWAGPVVAAAAILEPGCLVDDGQRVWTRFGVKIDDSKRLTPSQRREAYRVILKHARVGVGIVSSDVIDRINVFQATLQAMALALHDLHVQPDLVLVDGLHAPPVSMRCWTLVGGDHLSCSIACASIVAKVVRDTLMEFYHRVFPEYAFDRHKGYGTARHLERLLTYGPCALHRLSFRPVWSSAVAPPLREKADDALEVDAVPMVVASSAPVPSVRLIQG